MKIQQEAKHKFITPGWIKLTSTDNGFIIFKKLWFLAHLKLKAQQS